MVAQRIAYLGPPGTFCEQALRKMLSFDNAKALPLPSVSDAIDAVRNGDASSCLVPLENSVEGAIGVLHDELVNGGAALHIRRQVLLDVAFDAYVRSAQERDSIQTVASHPHAYAQCHKWVRKNFPDATFMPTGSTADAAREVQAGTYDLAICAPIAGEEYALTALATDIADHPGAVTRFVELVLATEPVAAPTGNDLTSLALSLTHDRAGSLSEALNELASRSINLTRIESRPTKKMLGHYWFFLDAQGHIAEPGMRDVVEALRKTSADLRFLGSYSAS